MPTWKQWVWTYSKTDKLFRDWHMPFLYFTHNQVQRVHISRHILYNRKSKINKKYKIMIFAFVFRSLFVWQSLLWPSSSQLLHLSYTMLTLLWIRQPSAMRDHPRCVTISIMPLYVSCTIICESPVILNSCVF